MNAFLRRRLVRFLGPLPIIALVFSAGGCHRSTDFTPTDFTPTDTRNHHTVDLEGASPTAAGPRTGRPSPSDAGLQPSLSVGDDEMAWKAARRILMQRRPTLEETFEISELAYRTDRREQAAELLQGWIGDSNTVSDAEVQRTVAILLEHGQLFEAIGVLRSALEKRPEQNEWRRQLFDFLIAAERRRFAIDHGRRLIRRRYFDLQVLRSLSIVENRDVESASVAELHRRNPKDVRLNIAEAREAHDEGQWDRCMDLLETILEAFPDDPAALAMQGRVLIRTANFQAVPEWSQRAFQSCQADWRYWTTLGDAARRDRRHHEAATYFLEASRLDADIEEVWTKLATALRSHAADALTPERSRTLAAIESRTQHLAQIHHLKSELQRFGNRDLWRFGKIAEELAAVGRLWEAEAWLAIGIQRSAMDPTKRSVSGGGDAFDPSDLVDQRGRLLKRFRADMPWQIEEGHPELSMRSEDWGLDTPEVLRNALTNSARGKHNDRADPTSFVASRPPSLANEAEQRGLTISPSGSHYQNDSSIPLHGTFESGLGVIDYDLDGWPDLHIAVAGEHPFDDPSIDGQLFRNFDGMFTEVTQASHTTGEGFGQGVVAGDINADGFADLLLLRFGADRLLINQGDGSFIDASERLGIQEPDHWSTSGAIADLDDDGLSDLVVLRYCDGASALAEDCHNGDGAMMACVPTKFPAARDRFFRGTADGNFEEATERWIERPPPPGRGLGVVVGNLDNDRGLEIFVANDMTANHLYQCEGPFGDEGHAAEDEQAPRSAFRLRESAMSHGVANNETSDTQACMGVAVGDFDGDQRVDLLVTNFAGEHNTLYRQEPGDVWSDRSVDFDLIGPSVDLLGFGAHAVDLDSDGRPEVAITNGHIYTAPQDGSEFLQPFQIFTLGSPNQLVALEVTEDSDQTSPPSGSYVDQLHCGRAMAVLDADRNGLPDLAITHQTEPVALLMNRTAVHGDRIRLRLRGVHCDRDAVGSVIDVQYGDALRREVVVSGDGFMCTNEDVRDIGLGATAEAGMTDVVVEIRWPHGRVERHRLRPNAEFLLVEGMPPFRTADIHR